MSRRKESDDKGGAEGAGWVGGGEQMEDRAVHREMKKAEKGGKWNQRMTAKKRMRQRRLCRGA